MLVLSALALAGCATTDNSLQTAEADLSASRLIRDNYLSQTQSDPLGAYLASKERRYSTPQNKPQKEAMVATALKMLGIKYRYGGDAPNTGFDCSGLVIYAAEKSLGLKLPRQSADIARQGESIDLDELKRGDLVFFNTLGRRFSHVGIYLGNSKFLHAPRSGAVVRIESMDINYWRKRYNGARRLAIRHNDADRLAIEANKLADASSDHKQASQVSVHTRKRLHKP
ncbi:C40 family peptidase [Pusillimonas sp. ANT_WB101]|uniref:C40 family peptidase n=1 Tax=Pusillimonas sp. ANT_WB101 TaxID=2597356 RepID=UPI0011EBE4F2|nr:C40 family peptidase [Pusillimonas sp. ANT_WB101]KAA0910570.1 NlpC/P60 family protein [Pusillimonas sp. ANT_WB101]